MGRATKHIEVLLELSAEERLEAANLLLDSLDVDEQADPEWEAAWAAELARRVEGLQNGSRQAVDSETVEARIAARLASLRR